MTIEQYIKQNPDWKLDSEYELDFTEPDNEAEAVTNIKYVLANNPTINTLAIVMRSYYGDTITWE